MGTSVFSFPDIICSFGKMDFNGKQKAEDRTVAVVISFGEC